MDPNNGDQFVDVTLNPDPRGKNRIINNEWKIFQDWDNPLYDW